MAERQRHGLVLNYGDTNRQLLQAQGPSGGGGRVLIQSIGIITTGEMSLAKLKCVVLSFGMCLRVQMGRHQVM